MQFGVPIAIALPQGGKINTHSYRNIQRRAIPCIVQDIERDTTLDTVYACATVAFKRNTTLHNRVH
jgi:hypothetical protein